MALITEIGSGAANGESYASVAEADAYLLARGNAVWGELDLDVREAALRRACDHMQQAYRGRWKGYRAYSTQNLDWPRQNVTLPDLPTNAMVPFNTVPAEVKAAQIELAWRASQSKGESLMPDQERGVLSETVGSLSVTYDPLSPQQPQYRGVDALVRHLLTGGSNMMQLVRA